MLKYLSFLCPLYISLILLTIGCSKPILRMPQPLPPIVKKYKHTTIHGNIPRMKNTGVHLEKEDVYSLFGKGKIYTWPKHSLKYIVIPGLRTIGRIGNNPYFSLNYYAFHGEPKVALDSGELYLGIIEGRHDRFGNPKEPEKFGNDIGSIEVDIIVWEREDWVQITDFYEKLKKQDPNNKLVDEALAQARRYKEVYLAEVKATKEVERVEKEIKELKKESEGVKEETVKSASESKTLPLPTSFDAALEKKEKIIQLEEKLAQLNETLAQLEEMKRKWNEERKKTKLLEKELEEQQKKEQELLTKLEKGSKNPPVIIIASPKNDATSEIPYIFLSGVAVDDEGLKQLDIFINDKASEDQERRGLKLAKLEYPKRFDFKERILLHQGENHIKIHAIDSDGLLTELILTVHKIERRRNIWAVVIGINDYQNIRKLRYSVNDANSFYHHLVAVNKIPSKNIILLIDEDATLTKIRSSLGTQLKNKAGKEDMVIIYFAGHGATEKDVTSPDGDGLEKYLLPYDVDPKDLYATALPMGEISRIFQRIQSDRLIFISDSCYSGASGGRTISLTEIRANISDAFLDRIATGKGKIILTASGANEVSAEKKHLQHGVFTYFLLEGMKGKADIDQDGLITVDEAYRYVSRRVPDATNQEQHPVKKGAVEGQLILSIIE